VAQPGRGLPRRPSAAAADPRRRLAGAAELRRERLPDRHHPERRRSNLHDRIFDARHDGHVGGGTGWAGLLRLELRLPPGHHRIEHRQVVAEVVSENTGKPIGFGLSVLRQIAHLVDAVILHIGYLLPLWTAKRQTLADKIMATVCLPLDRTASGTAEYGSLR